ncbi:MAG: transporter [Pseudomonadota bacterium]
MRDTCTARTVALLVAAGCAMAALPAAAAGADDPGQAGDMGRLLQQLNAKLDAQEAEIAELRAQVEELQLAQQRGRGVATAAPAASQAAQDAPAQDGPSVAQAGPAPAADEPVRVGQARQQEDAARREQDKALVVREHAPLFERKFTFESGFAYSYYDRRQLTLSGFLALDAIFLGTINLDQVKASLATFDFSARYGLTDRLSIEGNVPYVFRDTRFISGGAGGAASTLSEARVRSKGLGDASVAAFYQLVKETASVPDVVASLRVRAPTGRDPFGLKLIQADGENSNLNVPEELPTGSGMWSATANVSVLRTYDPVILFGNLGYTYYRPRDFDDISPVVDTLAPARVALGDILQLSGGLAIALNDRAATSFSIASALQQATHTRAPGQAWTRVPGSSSNSTTFNIGASYVLPSGWTFNGQLAAGLTPDSPNFVFALRGSRSF